MQVELGGEGEGELADLRHFKLKKGETERGKRGCRRASVSVKGVRPMLMMRAHTSRSQYQVSENGRGESFDCNH
jgi:hypothetical protein